MFEININKRVEGFVAGLEISTRDKVARSINLLEEFGYLLRMPHSKNITNKIFELRIRGKHEIRIFYCQHNNQYYLLSGFIKKTQKTPLREVQKAIRMFEELTQYNT
jgi:phage-related protein